MSATNILQLARPLPSTEVALPETAHTLRLRRGYTQKAVAEMLGKPNSWVSKVEHGHLTLSGPDLEAYASILEVKPQLLTEPIPSISAEDFYFRKYKIPEKTIKLIQAEAAVRIKTISTLAQSAGYSVEARHKELNTETVPDGALGAARIYRKRWKLDNGPIKDLSGHIENEGIHISPMPLSVEKVAGFSALSADKTCPSIMFNSKLHGNTQRFTLAHELGHLVLDRLSPRLDSKETERRADAFAGELLAPYIYFQDDFRSLRTGDVSALLKLSQKWGLHPSSFVTRAKQEGDISPDQAATWYRNMNGTKKILINATPTPFPVQARLIGHYISKLKERGWSLPEIGNKSNMLISDLEEYATSDSWPYKMTQVTEFPKLHLAV